MNEETLFNLALEKSAHERSAFLESACGGDTELRLRIERLLKSHDDPGSFLQEPILPSTGGQPSEATQALEPGAASPTDGPKTQTDLTQSNFEDLAFLVPSTRPDALGRLEHYHILQVVGKGGFGIVLKAFDEKLHRVVAIKVLSVELSANGTARQRFIREARTAAAVSHEHVVTIHAVVEEHRPPFLVMQMVDGVTLQEKLDKVGMLSLREILRIGMQMAEGLAAAHKQGLVHRDIKPANILLENGVERVKITDFGLARAVDDASVTQSGTVAGTPMYMSPEQAEGLAIDHRSDLFSLGTVLYAMCTGHSAFRASGTHAVLKRVIEASPRPIREVNNEIPDWLCDIISKLHAKKPEDRFQTAKEIAELLGQHLAHLQQPNTAPRPAPVIVLPPVEKSRRAWSRTVRVGAILAGVALLATVVLASPFLYRYVTNQSTLIFSGTMDPNLDKILVKQQGETVGELTTTNGMVHLPAGDYDAEVVPKEGFKLSKFRVGSSNSSGSAGWHQATDPSFPVRLARGDHVSINVELEEVPAGPTNIPPEPGWVQLFNGKDLTGWKTHPTQPGNWKVEAGTLVGRGTPASHLFSERGDFDNFHLRVNAKIGVIGDSGISFGHAFVLRDEPLRLPHGFEANIASGSIHKTGSLWVPGVQLTGPAADPVKPGEWFTMEVIVRGKQIVIKVNDKITAEYTNQTYSFTKGHLALQAWVPEMVVHFKKIEFKELPPEEPGWVQLFNGKDLTGWKTHLMQPGNWHVENKELVSRGAPGCLFSERADWQDFHLRVEVYAERGANSSIWVRTPSALQRVSPPAPKTFAPPGPYEVDLFRGGLTAKPGRIKGLAEVTETLAQPSEWMTLEIIAQGNRLITRVNGKQAVDVVDNKSSARSGHLALQAFTASTTVRFKKIEIKELPPEEAGWVQLFNGKDLTGWHEKKFQKNVWKVVNGIIKGQGTDRNLLWSDRADYRNFHLKVETRVQATGDGSISFRRSNKKFYEAKIRPGSQAPTGVLFRSPDATPLSTTMFPPPDEWFTLEVIARGSRLQVLVNGKTAADVLDTTSMEGQLTIQAHGTGGSVEYRKIAIKELPPDEPGWVSLFNGNDLSGWIDHHPQNMAWKVEEGILHARGKSSTLTKTRKDLADFHLRLEMKTDSLTRAMLFPRSDLPKDIGHGIWLMGVKDQFTPFSLARPPKTVQQAKSFSANPDDWLLVEIVARGKQLLIKVNGEQVLDWVDPAPVTAKGQIALMQLPKCGPMQIRKIEFKPLPPEEPGWVKLFNGKNLDGWHIQDKGDWSVTGSAGDIICTTTAAPAFLNSVRDDFENFHLKAKISLTPYPPLAKKAFPASAKGAIWFRNTPGLNGYQALFSTLAGQTGQLAVREGNLGALTLLTKAPAVSMTEKTWFDYEIIANGTNITVKVDGKETTKVTDSHWRRGQIVLAVDPRSIVRFKDIEIKELPPEDPGWVQLFNRKDLTGWSIIKGSQATWKVDQGVLIGTGNPKEIHRLCTDRVDFTDFHLRVEAKYVGKRNQLAFRMQGPPLHACYFVNMIDKAQPMNTGAISCVSGKKAMAALAIEDLTKPGEWFTLEVVAQGNRLQTFVNGKKAVDTVDAAENFMKGGFALLSAGTDELHVRKFEIKELPPAPNFDARKTYHTDVVLALASPPAADWIKRVHKDGILVVSLGRDRGIVHWKADKSRGQDGIAAAGGPIGAVDVSADGHLAAVAWPEFEMVEIWEAISKSGAASKRLHTIRDPLLKDVHLVRFSPDGEKLLTVSPTNNTLWDFRGGKALKTLRQKTIAAGFSPSGRLLALASEVSVQDKRLQSVLILDMDKLLPLNKQPGVSATIKVIAAPSPSPICQLAFATDDNILAIGQDDGTITLIDTKTEKPIQSFPHAYAGQGALSHLEFRNKDKLLVAALDSRLVRFWNVDTKELLFEAIAPPGSARKVCLSADGRTLFAAGGEIWNAEAGKFTITNDFALYQWKLPESVWPKSRQISLRFSGEHQFVDVPTLKLDAKGPFTIEAEVTLDTLERPGPGFIAGVRTQSGIAIENDRWKFFGYAKPDKTRSFVVPPFTQGKRIHLALVINGGKLRPYVNGQHPSADQALEELMPTDDWFRIGGFPGLVHQVRISSVARTEFTPGKRFEVDKDTLALYACDDGQEAKLTDSSGKGHHGNIIRASWVNSDGSPLAQAEPWVQLFNGYDLKGWGGDEKVWKVVDGELINKFGGSSGSSYLSTEQGTHANFHLRATVKVVPVAGKTGTAGVWVRRIADFTGYKAHLSTGAGQLGTLMARAKPEDEPTKLSKDGISLPGDQWFDLEIIANGPNLVVKINGKETANVKDERYRVGRIALERVPDGLIYFKKIEIKELPP